MVEVPFGAHCLGIEAVCVSDLSFGSERQAGANTMLLFSSIMTEHLNLPES